MVDSESNLDKSECMDCKNVPKGCSFAVSNAPIKDHENNCKFKGVKGVAIPKDQFHCQFAEDGCDFHIDKTVLLDHQTECAYRTVPCPDGLCEEKVRLVDLESHIKRVHSDAVWEDDPGPTLGRIWFIDSNVHYNTASNNWILNMWTHDDHTFIARFRKLHGIWYSWVYVIGGARTAGRFMSEIATENPDGNADCALLYLGRVHPVDEPESEITKSGDCFVMTNEVVNNHITQVKKVGMFKEGYDMRLGMDYTIMRTEQENR